MEEKQLQKLKNDQKLKSQKSSYSSGIHLLFQKKQQILTQELPELLEHSQLYMTTHTNLTAEHGTILQVKTSCKYSWRGQLQVQLKDNLRNKSWFYLHSLFVHLSLLCKILEHRREVPKKILSQKNRTDRPGNCIFPHSK